MAAVDSFGLGPVGRLMERAVEVVGAVEDVVEVVAMEQEHQASEASEATNAESAESAESAECAEDEARIRAVGADGIVLTGAVLRELRERLPRMPVRELAARIHYSRSQIYAWESGEHAVPLEMYLPILETIIAWRTEQTEWQQMVHATRSRLR